MKISTRVITCDSRHNLNAVIKVEIRNLIHTKNNLIQPVSTSVELTKSGARQLIEQLEIALKLEETLDTPDYMLQDGMLVIDGKTYDTYPYYMMGIEAAD